MNNLESIDSKLRLINCFYEIFSYFNLDTLAFPTADDCSTKLLSLLRSINLEKYWSTFERNEVNLNSYFE
jgi:hypothetical protein